jgi:hypothetical protein
MPRRERRSPWSSREDKVVSRRSLVSRSRLLAAAGLAAAGGLVLAVLWWPVSTSVPPMPGPPGHRQAPEAAAAGRPLPGAAVPESPLPARQARAGHGASAPLPGGAPATMGLQDEGLGELQPGEEIVLELPPPDPLVAGLDRSLLGRREAELRAYLADADLEDGQIKAAWSVALEAREPETRAIAISALGRSHADLAREKLIELFDRTASESEQSLILGSVRAEDLEDPAVAWMLTKLAAPEVSVALKRQIAYSLARAALQDAGGTAGLGVLLQAAPADWRDAVRQAYEQLGAS